MDRTPLLLALLSAVAVFAFGAWALWRHAEKERARWQRYNRPRGPAPKIWVCPTCLTRHQGAKAVEEQRCRACEEAGR